MKTTHKSPSIKMARAAPAPMPPLAAHVFAVRLNRYGPQRSSRPFNRASIAASAEPVQVHLQSPPVPTKLRAAMCTATAPAHCKASSIHESLEPRKMLRRTLQMGAALWPRALINVKHKQATESSVSRICPLYLHLVELTGRAPSQAQSSRWKHQSPEPPLAAFLGSAVPRDPTVPRSGHTQTRA